MNLNLYFKSEKGRRIEVTWNQLLWNFEEAVGMPDYVYSQEEERVQGIDVRQAAWGGGENERKFENFKEKAQEFGPSESPSYTHEGTFRDLYAPKTHCQDSRLICICINELV